MKIFSAAQIQACDAQTILAEGIQSIDLMDRAASKCVDWIREHFSKDMLFIVLCGTGNNGGDGLAITRLLHQKGYGAKAFQLRLNEHISEPCQEQQRRLLSLEKHLHTMVEPDTYITDLPQNIVIVDALLGIGINKPISGWLANFIKNINKLSNRKIAIDIPSGMTPDAVPDPESTVLHADDTLSFQFYKRIFLHPESSPYAGNIHILDIGLDAQYIQNTHSIYSIAEPNDIKQIFTKRHRFTHKGTYGNALLIGGSYGKTGAILLSTKAALRAGAGLVTTLAPTCSLPILQTAIPEAMCQTSGADYIELIDDVEKYNAIGMGPGMGTDERTAQALSTFLESSGKPLVIDADALNILANHKELLSRLPNGSILTPHPKEFNRLFGENTTSMIQLDHARIQAMRYNLNIVLKGHHTAIINTEGECVYNMTGNAGMATGGSGDVLTGIITALLAQGYAPDKAAMLGVYLHGLAGDLATQDLSEEALIASDIIQYLGKAFQHLHLLGDS